MVYVHERAGDPFGDTESFILMGVKGGDASKDLLFTGGDFNNESMRAFRRAPAEGPAVGGE